MAKSDYCSRSAVPMWEQIKKENPKLTTYQIALQIQQKIVNFKGEPYRVDTILRSITGATGVRQIGSGPILDGASTAPASTPSQAIAPANFCFDIEIPPTAYDPERFKKVHIPRDNYKFLLLYDIHMPYHHEANLKTAIRTGKDKGVDEVMIMGDGMDFCGLSKFEQRPRERNVNTELLTVWQFLRNLRAFMPNEKITWKEGNHELRLERWKMRKASEFDDVEDMKFANVLKLKDFGIEHVDDKTIIQIGKLNAMHGHEVAGGGENVAKNKLKRTMCNTIFGHSHLSQSLVTKTLVGDYIGTWSVGPLCHMSPGYNPFNQWIGGFAIVTVNMDQSFEVDNKFILDGKVL